MRHETFMPKFELGEKIDPKAPKVLATEHTNLGNTPSLKFDDTCPPKLTTRIVTDCFEYYEYVYGDGRKVTEYCEYLEPHYNS